MLHSLADFAQVCHVSKPAITQAVKRGLIIRGADGKIDDTDPVNALYLGGKTGAVKKVAPAGGAGRKAKAATPTTSDAQLTAAVLKAQAKRERKKRTEPGDSMTGEVEDDPDLRAETDQDFAELLEKLKEHGGQAALLLRKLLADIAYKEEGADKLALDKEQRKKNLIERSVVQTKIQAINKAINDHVTMQHARTGPVLYALAKREGSSELEITRRLELDYGTAVRKAIEDITRANG